MRIHITLAIYALHSTPLLYNKTSDKNSKILTKLKHTPRTLKYRESHHNVKFEERL